MRGGAGVAAALSSRPDHRDGAMGMLELVSTVSRAFPRLCSVTHVAVVLRETCGQFLNTHTSSWNIDKFFVLCKTFTSFS